jgi:hypothetical protein
VGQEVTAAGVRVTPPQARHEAVVIFTPQSKTGIIFALTENE